MTAPIRKRPLALLGGTFDPVHYGHLRLAAEVKTALDFDEVRLVPAGDPPHRAAPCASAAQRLAMLELALGEFPGLSVDTREIARRGKSYTVTTLEELRAEVAERALVLIVGTDAFLGLTGWNRWQRLFELAHFVVVARPGATLEGRMEAPLLAEWQSRHVEDPERLALDPAGLIYRQTIIPQPISASAIRAAVVRGAAGLAQVSGLLPPAVLAYIERNRLYQVPDAP